MSGTLGYEERGTPCAIPNLDAASVFTISMKLLHNLHAILFHPHDEWFPQIFCSCQFHLQDYLRELEYLLYFLDRHNGQLKLLRAKTSTCFH